MSLRINKAEAWALEIVHHVEKGLHIEDSRVELKREWPDHENAARRIAGHANACFGSDIIWVIGLDEKDGVTGVKPEELSSWWPSVTSNFDGPTPSLTEFTLHINNKLLVCLLFETTRPPYVIKNTKYGKEKGHTINWEVPWREGTSVRTATRNDLIRILIPTLSRPEFEILDGYGTSNNQSPNIHNNHTGGEKLYFSIDVYIYPRNELPIVIPFHKCECVLSDEDGNAIDEFSFTMYRPHRYSSHQGATPDTVTLERTSSELIAHGPGKCTIEVEKLLEHAPSWLSTANLRLRFLIHVIDSDLPVEISTQINHTSPRKDENHRWSVLTQLKEDEPYHDDEVIIEEDDN